MSMDQRAQILKTVSTAERGIREVIRELRWAPSRTVDLLRKMEDEGLIIQAKNNSTQPSMPARKGRPKKIMTCTRLGIEFLDTYRKLKMKLLRARKEDLEHATGDALYAERLVTAGHSPFQLFMELTDIANNIKISSETS